MLDVAREAGVSYSTVSRVNDMNSIAPEKRARVLEVIQRLECVPNIQARKLTASSRTCSSTMKAFGAARERLDGYHATFADFHCEVDRTLICEGDFQRPRARAAARALLSGFVRPTAIFASNVSYTVWGFTDEHSWVPHAFNGQGAATLFDELLNPKPAYVAVANALAEGVIP